MAHSGEPSASVAPAEGSLFHLLSAGGSGDARRLRSDPTRPDRQARPRAGRVSGLRPAWLVWHRLDRGGDRHGRQAYGLAAPPRKRVRTPTGIRRGWHLRSALRGPFDPRAWQSRFVASIVASRSQLGACRAERHARGPLAQNRQETSGCRRQPLVSSSRTSDNVCSLSRLGPSKPALGLTAT